jgi:tetratricopeptide (TPR) repeat protein
VVALLDNARKYASAKDYDKAAAALEGAIHIEPKNAGIWRDLALMRLYQGKYKQAEDTAARAKSLAGNDERVRAKSQEVIVAAQAKAAEASTQTSK